MKFASFFLLFSLLFTSSQSLAWGERGHDLVARVAARLVIARSGDELAKPFVAKEHMLGHLSNVPDFHWKSRAVGKEVNDANYPTHFIDMEYLHPAPSIKNMPRTTKDMVAAMKKFCAIKTKDYVCPKGAEKEPKASMAGTAPFRVEQLFKMMTKALAGIKKDDKDSLTDGVNEALRIAGIMAHFVADLGMPLHNSRDYNGWEAGQGGIHSYFETDMVNALPLALDAEVYKAASRSPSKKLLKVVSKQDKANPLMLSFALGLESFADKGQMFALDTKHSLIEKSTKTKDSKKYAKRKSAKDMAKHFKPMIIKRLALAADTLAVIWTNSWKAAGKPDLSKYRSYTYPLAPKFIEVDY